MSSRTIFLMDLPNPVHGMSNVNLAVKSEAETNGNSPLVINSAPSYAAKYFNTRWWGIFKLLHSLMCLFKLFVRSLNFKSKVLYRPINGGVGQVYDIAYLLVARFFRLKIYIHHHSFNYLNDRSKLFAFLSFIAGRSAKHVVLGSRMKSVLSELYNIVPNNVVVISNLAYFPSSELPESSSVETIRLGHLANLCFEKGADTFVELCRELLKNDVPISAKIAGPFADDRTKEYILNAVEEIEELEYVGPVYSEDKSEFYSQLDFFVFPSRYKNEAEPLVLFEAANFGTFLIGTQRGCMKDVIEALNGLSFSETDTLVGTMANEIINVINNNSLDIESRKYRFNYFKDEQLHAKKALSDFLNEMRDYELSKTR